MTAELQAGLDAPSLVELAVRRLRAEIVSGAFAPGERLVEEQLTRRFGISRAPLREALRLLGQQGLVEHLPRRGVRVVALSARDIDELFSLRDVLERFALECALGGAESPIRTGSRSRAPPSSAWRRRRATPPRRPPRTARSTCRWSTLAGHQHLLRVYEPVLLQLQLYMATNMRREAERRPATEGAHRHRRLYEAVAGGDLRRRARRADPPRQPDLPRARARPGVASVTRR